MILIGLLAALLFWVVEACIHALVFGDGSVASNLVAMDANELWMRTFACTLIFALGVHAHFAMDRLRAAHADRERLHGELEEALAKVLGGFIPICMHCKNIRGRQNEWTEVEAYVEEHSDAVFSHGLCPDCLTRHYPEQGGSRAHRLARMERVP